MIMREKKRKQWRRAGIIHILDAISTANNCDLDIFLTRAKTTESIDCIRAACYFLIKYSFFSSVQIGKFLDDRDHATILHHKKRYYELLSCDKEIKEKHQLIEQLIKNPKCTKKMNQYLKIDHQHAILQIKASALNDFCEKGLCDINTAAFFWLAGYEKAKQK